MARDDKKTIETAVKIVRKAAIAVTPVPIRPFTSIMAQNITILAGDAISKSTGGEGIFSDTSNEPYDHSISYNQMKQKALNKFFDDPVPVLKEIGKDLVGW